MINEANAVLSDPDRETLHWSITLKAMDPAIRREAYVHFTHP